MHADPPEIHASHPIPVRQAGVLLSASFIKVVASLDLHDSLVLPRFGRTADFHRIDTRALLGAHTKCPLSFRTAGILFSPMQNHTGALVPDDTNQSKSPPVRSVVILQRDDRVAGDESFRARSGGNPWCGNIRWNPFQRSCRPDTVFFPHSTCCTFQAKSKSRSEFSSSVDA